MRRTYLGLIVTLLLCAMGCGDDGAVADASTDADAADTNGDGGPTGTADPPEAPAAPSLGPCEGGWVEVALGDVAYCDPYPDGVADCADHEAHFPGGAGCEVVGAACPSGDFPSDVPDDGSAAFVLASAAGGGDGSRALPVRTIAEGVALGRSSIAVGPGTYDEEVNLPAGTTLRGACSERTILTNTVADRNRPVVNPMGSAVTVRDLTIADAARSAVRADATATIELVGVVVDGASRIGVAATNGGSLTLRDSMVRGTRFAGDEFAEGVFAIGNATLRLERVVVSDNEHSGIIASGAGSDAMLRDVAVVGHQGPSVFIQLGATAEMTRIVVQDGRERGVLVGGMNASVVLRNSLVRDIGPSLTGTFGFGLTARDVSSLTVRQTAVLRVTGAGLATQRASVDTEDLLIVDVDPISVDGTAGRGVTAQPGTTLTMTRTHIERAHDTGFIVGGTGTTATIADLVVRDTRPRMDDGTRGRGLHVQLAGSTTTADRVRIENSVEGAVVVADAALTIRDLDIIDVASREDSGDYGRGLEVGLAGTVDATRVRIMGALDISMLASGAGSRISATDVAILGTTQSSSGEGGHGLGAYEGAVVMLEDFLVDQTAICGVQVATDGSLDLMTGRVSNAEIGACVQVDGYDVDRLTNDVRYIDNASSLDATSLPVPEPLPNLTD